MADSWLNEYMEALEARDRVGKANIELYEACLLFVPSHIPDLL